VRRPASGAERLNGSCVAAQATMPGQSDGSASTWGTLCGHRAGSDGTLAGGARQRRAARHARKQGARVRAPRGVLRVRGEDAGDGRRGAEHGHALRMRARCGVAGAEPALGARARGSRERREEQEGRKEKRKGREGRKRKKGKKRKGKGRKRKGKMGKKKGKKKWERKNKGKEKKMGRRERMTRAGGIRARDVRTQREENSGGGGKKTRRRQSRRRPRPVGHARAAFARGEREKRKGVASALITAGGLA
jgi:hypothetical protein